jgi:hypothetical protein
MMDAETLLQQFEPKPTGTAVEYERQLWQARYSPCGRFLIACGYDATVQRWDVSGDEIKQLEPLSGHDGWVQCMAFHPSEDRLYTADSWGRLLCRPVADESPEPSWEVPQAHDGWVRALAVSPDGALLATGGNDKVIRIRSCRDAALESELATPEKLFSLCFHPDGKSLVSGDLKGIVRQWDVESGQCARQLDASILYQLHRIQQCGGARHLAFNPAGDLLACAGQKTPSGGFATGFPCVLVFDWKTGEVVREMQVGGDQDGFAYDAQFHPAGFVMAVSCAFPGKGHLWFWRPEDDKPFYESNSIPNGRSLSLHADGRRVAMMVSLSANGNGRQLRDGRYVGGTSKIHILQFAETIVEEQAAPVQG